MAPDKIFLQVCGSCNLDETCENCEFAKLLDGGEVTWSEDRIYEKDEEYIRKDALLEWARERLDFACALKSEGQKTVCKEFINKIESL